MARLVALVVLLVATRSFAVTPAARCTVRLSPGDDVQRAIDRPPRMGAARVCLAAGEYRLRGLLSIRRDDVTLRGDGPSTVLRLEEGVESPVVVIGDYEHEVPRRPTSNVTVERMRVVGGGKAGGEAHPAYPYLNNSAIVVRAGRGVTIRDVDVTACRSACILTERDTRGVAIDDDRVSGSVWDGISLNRTARAHLGGNVIRDDTAAGITADHLEDSVIERNVVEDNETYAVYLSDSRRNRFVENRFVDNVLSAAFVTCAVRERMPPVTCWPGSMSEANQFLRNEIAGNRVGFTVAPNATADCAAPGFVANRSVDDAFARNPRDEPYDARYGRCLVFIPPATPARPAPARNGGAERR